MIELEALGATGLVQPGSLLRYLLRLDLPPALSAETWRTQLGQAFPDATWVVRDLRNAQPALKRWIDRLAVFLTLVGLTALLIGGIGVGNAIRAYLDGKVETIATLKCLGASGDLVFAIYLAQIMLLATLGIVLGVVIGAAVPFVVAAVAGDKLPVPPVLGLYPGALGLAALFGLLVALVFAIWPLAKARDVPAAGLFRALVAPSSAWPRPKYLLALAVLGAALALLAIFSGEQARFAAWFVVGAVGALAVFRLAASGIMAVARAVGRPRDHRWRLALASLIRPGAPTASVLVSIGAGLSVLVAVAQLEGNLRRQIAERIPERAPTFFFIDIQPPQAEAFETTVRAFGGTEDLQRVPTMRGRIVAIRGRPVKELRIPPSSEWAVRSDLGLSYAALPPANARLAGGSWWPSDYAGPPLVSFDAAVGRDLGLALGDEITVSVLGREIAARIGNFREIDWSEFGLNFAVIFAPGALDGAPQVHVASVRAPAGRENELDRAVAGAFPNVTAIRVKEVIEQVAVLLERIATATRATAAVTLAAGALVLAGAIAGGHRQRVFEAVILKVLGARRRTVMAAQLLEFAILGLVAALLATGIGSIAAWAVLVPVMGSDFVFVPVAALVAAIAGLGVTLLLGFAGIYRALGRRPAPELRTA
ncbi:MAG: FtsX-like permease family protein [Alphaproteobacteria bacterium]|nr:FtsX-like permease family protein [Alphaproteobacteria bacterium]